MNRLTPSKRTQVIAAPVEGNSIRATVRMTGVAKNTVVKLLAEIIGTRLFSGMAVGEYSEYSLAKACLIIETPSKLKFRVPNAGLQKTKKRLTQGSVAAVVQGAILNKGSIRGSHRYCKLKIAITLTY